MKRLLYNLYHHLPDRWKRLIRLYSYSYNDVKAGRSTFKSRITREMISFLTDKEKEDKAYVARIKKDIRKCWLKYGSSPEEYFLFGFQELDDAGRKCFITDYEKDMTLKDRIGLDTFSKELRDKYNFYCKTKPFFKREAFKMSPLTPESDFVQFALRVKHLFIKPENQSRGRGAYKVEIETIEDAQKEYISLKESEMEWMVEETIVSCSAMQEWNPSSVNTIRIPTFLNKEGFFIGVPFFRTGRAGSCVDNAGLGGIFANVDANTGILYTDGIDEGGHIYEKHPDSALVFKGWQVPRWQELLNTVEIIHKTCMPHHLYIGWDFALTDSGWVLIEGNWGQFISQYADHVGFRDRFVKYMNAESYV